MLISVPSVSPWFAKMPAKPQKCGTDPERLRRNLLAWADITALCIELRKSVLKAKTGIEDDEELTRRVFAEAVARKEKKWESMRP